MFRRTKSETTAPQVVTKPDGKGRPTPSRREAEAAAKARAKVPRDRKEQARAQRAARSESSQSVRAAMKAGDERYYLPRDQGPVRRFIRDFVDSRFSFIELMIPLLLVTMVLGYSGNAAARRDRQHDPDGHDPARRPRHVHAAPQAAPRAHPPVPGRAAEGHDLLRGSPGRCR